jgi:hypothetical protein
MTSFFRLVNSSKEYFGNLFKNFEQSSLNSASFDRRPERLRPIIVFADLYR